MTLLSLDYKETQLSDQQFTVAQMRYGPALALVWYGPSRTSEGLCSYILGRYELDWYETDTDRGTAKATDYYLG